jgi:hypothetical protein
MSTGTPASTQTPHEPAPPPRDVPLIEISSAIRTSQEAFRNALPELLKTKAESKQWVAFCGLELVALGCTKTEVYQECLRRGLKRGTFVVRIIEPEASNETEISWDA